MIRPEGLPFLTRHYGLQGIYVKPGLQPPPGERKLYLLIEVSRVPHPKPSKRASLATPALAKFSTLSLSLSLSLSFLFSSLLSFSLLFSSLLSLSLSLSPCLSVSLSLCYLSLSISHSNDARLSTGRKRDEGQECGAPVQEDAAGCRYGGCRVQGRAGKALLKVHCLDLSIEITPWLEER